MATITSLTTTAMGLVLLTSNITANISGEVVVVGLDDTCPNSFTRLDLHDRVVVKTRSWPDKPFPVEANSSCSVEFMTANEDQGICFVSNQLFLRKGPDDLKINFFTSKYGPEKIIDRYHFQGLTKWCTESPLVTMEITTTDYFDNEAAEFFFTFDVQNVSKSEMTKQFVMDSHEYCNRSHELKPGESIEVVGQRYPNPHILPAACQLTLTTSGNEEYEQLCVNVHKYKKEVSCQGTLTVDGFHEDYWETTQHLGCKEIPEETLSDESETLCSGNKQLTFTLIRTDDRDTGMVFRAKVTNMWHPRWLDMSSVKEQLAGLGFVKGLTVFIAAFDSIVGILAAVLATMIRNPASFWKEWAETMGEGSKSESVHYEASYPEVSCSKDEEAPPEAKAY